MKRAQEKGKKVFVTVGTTRFDELIHALNDEECLKALSCNGFNQITMQIGNSGTEPRKNSLIEVDWYQFKPSIQDDMNNSDLVICHAGAGSVLEALKANKPLIVVVNDKLMDNHQTELAEAFAETKNLVCCNTRSLASTIKDTEFSNLIPFVHRKSEIFGAYMNEFMGVT